MEMKLFFLVFSLLKATLVVHGQSGDKITASNSIVDGQTLVSTGGVFELGFFTLGDANKRFLGTWFKNISVKTIVWVANRNDPLENTGGTLNLTADGNLALFNNNGFIVWSTNTSNTNLTLQLLDTGNLVLTGGASNSNILWQSFYEVLHLRDKMTPSNSIVDGQTLVSARGVFELGFFNRSDMKNMFLGIWFRNISVQTIVWVANRDTPLENTGGTLNLTADGNLALFNNNGFIVWSTNTSNTNPTLQLLDTGNLVLTGGAPNSIILWQSFSHPTDTYLFGMRLGFDYRRNLSMYLTSWKSASDLSSGEYVYKMEAQVFQQVRLLKGSICIFRSGPWMGKRYSGRPNIIQLQYTSNQYELSYGYNVMDDTIPRKATLTTNGKYQFSTWTFGSNEWKLIWEIPDGMCDQYATCGGNCICTTSYSSLCQCMKGFVPKKNEDQVMWQNSGGCVRRIALNCSTDGFFLLTNVKLPDSLNARATNKTIDECSGWCLKDCSCIAYAVIGGGGCLTWYGDLLDIRQFDDSGDPLYIRLAASELGSSGNKNTTKIKFITVALGIFMLACLSLVLWLKWKRRQGKLKKLHSQRNEDDELQLPLFDMLTIRTATKEFSNENVIGRGGFGPVYKGKLENGVAIAVKRLSKDSHQGIDEFKTEVRLIAKLQHKNLVRLLGCCVEGEERILVYEYMQNKSLDAFIFDKINGGLLGWKERLEIIKGIARGLLYLHHDSRLKIIHRDLKTSNILLDKEMNPKISDFGTARIFKVDQNVENTKRIVGTYGYMAPEYLMKGLFSEKSDVFSFGVIVLEILSGKKSRTTGQNEPYMNLIQQASGLWREGKCLELVDEVMGESYPKSKVQRFIHVALLCVQEGSDDRPTMENVVLMLSCEDIMIPDPRSIALYTTNNFEQNWNSSNEISVTVLEGR